MQSACAVLYCRLWRALLYHIFPRYFINSAIKNIYIYISLSIKCVLIFSTNLSEAFLILRRIQRDIVINVKTFSTRYFWRILMKLGGFSIDFRQNANTKFYQNPSSGMRSSLMRIDGRTDVTKLIVTFRSFAKAPEKWQWCYRVLPNRWREWSLVTGAGREPNPWLRWSDDVNVLHSLCLWYKEKDIFAWAGQNESRHEWTFLILLCAKQRSKFVQLPEGLRHVHNAVIRK